MSLALAVSQLPAGLQQLIENNNQGSSTNSLVVSVNGVLYYITLAQVGTTQATGNLWILKSLDAGASWSLILNSGRGYGNVIAAFTQLVVTVSGTNIYIVVQPNVGSGVVVFTLQTPSDTFATDSPIGPVGQVDSFASIGAAAFVDGTILVAGKNTVTGAVSVARYSPGSNTWSAASDIEAAALNNGIASVIAEPVNNRAYVFYTSSADFLHFTLKCAPITNPTTVGTIKTLTTITGDTEPAVQYWTGIPCVTNSQVLMPVISGGTPAHPQANVLTVYRATFNTNPTFVAETVQAGITGKALTTFYLTPLPVSALIQYGGVSYIFFSADNGVALGSALSQSYLYYQTNSGAGWSAPTLLYTSPLSREPFTPYPVLVTSTQLGVLWMLADPTRFFDTTDPQAKINALSPYFFVEANQFSLQKVVVAMKPNRHLPVRGAAQ